MVGGDWVANTAVLGRSVLAIGAALAGLYAVIGTAGLLIGALIIVFVGDPFSAVGSAPELLPQSVGAIGQLMPPGAGANLLRSTGFFDGAGAGSHLMVLAAWSLAGLALLAAAALRSRRRAESSRARAARHSDGAEADPVVTCDWPNRVWIGHTLISRGARFGALDSTHGRSPWGATLKAD